MSFITKLGKKRDLMYELMGYDVLLDFILCDATKICVELETRLRADNFSPHEKEKYPLLLKDFISIQSRVSSRLEEKRLVNNITEIETYENKRDLLKASLETQSQSDHLLAFVQNITSEVCADLMSKLNGEICPSDKIRYSKLLEEFTTIRQKVPTKKIDIKIMKANDFEVAYAYLSYESDTEQIDFDIFLKTINHLVEELKRNLTQVSKFCAEQKKSYRASLANLVVLRLHIISLHKKRGFAVLETSSELEWCNVSSEKRSLMAVISNVNEHKEHSAFMNAAKPVFTEKMKNVINDFKAIELQCTLFVRYKTERDSAITKKTFVHFSRKCSADISSNFEDIFEIHIHASIASRIPVFEEKFYEWSLDEILHLTIDVDEISENKFCKLNGCTDDFWKQRSGLIKLTDLTQGKKYLVREIEKKYTKYGKAMRVSLEAAGNMYLPKAVSSRLYKNKEELKQWQNLIKDEKFYVVSDGSGLDLVIG